MVNFFLSIFYKLTIRFIEYFPIYSVFLSKMLCKIHDKIYPIQYPDAGQAVIRRSDKKLFYFYYRSVGGEHCYFKSDDWYCHLPNVNAITCLSANINKYFVYSINIETLYGNKKIKNIAQKLQEHQRHIF